MTDFQLATGVSHWLAKFEAALPRGEALAELFHADSHWRDVLALTWRIRTTSGREAIALRPHRSADDIVYVEDPSGLFRPDVPLVQREHRPLRNDEEAPELGEPGDHVVGERVCGPAPNRSGSRAVDERHNRNGAATTS